MPRTIWKGAISFGLVNIPVALRAASRGHDLSFDWIDKRDMAPVGYKRINKRSGEAIESENIVKGYEYEPGQYVLLNAEDFKQANPEATQTVEIHGFVDVKEITPEYFETPYYLEALKRGEKGYALLRQVLRDSRRVGLATVVMNSKQHLAALLVRGEWLMLNTMRWADEVLPAKDMVTVDDDPKRLGVGERELDMARRLVDEMTQPWKPEEHHDTYREDLVARIQARIEAGQTHELAAPADETAPGKGGGKVIDLMAALRQSLERKPGRSAGSAVATAEGSAPARKEAPSRRTRAPAVAATPKSARRAAAKSAPAARKRA